MTTTTKEERQRRIEDASQFAGTFRRVCAPPRGSLTEKFYGTIEFLLEELTRREHEKQHEIAEGEAVLYMTVARLKGIVEGAPTARHNFLQRIDQLVDDEQRHAQELAEAKSKEDRLRKLLRQSDGSSACSCFHGDHTDFEGANDGCGHHPTVEFAHDENVCEVVGFCQRCMNDHSPIAALRACRFTEKA